MGESNVSVTDILAGINEKFRIKLIDNAHTPTDIAVFTVKVDDDGHVDVIDKSVDFDLPDGIRELDLIEDHIDTMIPGIEYAVVMLERDPPMEQKHQERVPERIGKFSDCFVLYDAEDNLPNPLVSFSVTRGSISNIQYDQSLAHSEAEAVREFVKVVGIYPAAKHIHQFHPSSTRRYTLHAVSDQVLTGEFKKFMFNKKNKDRNLATQEVTQNESKVSDHIVLSENCPEGATEIAYIPSDKKSFTVNLSFYDLQGIKDELDVPMEALVARILNLWKETEIMSFSSFIYIVYARVIHEKPPADNRDTSDIREDTPHSAVSQIDNMISLLKSR